jgi:hypothetical protein
LRLSEPSTLVVVVVVVVVDGRLPPTHHRVGCQKFVMQATLRKEGCRSDGCVCDGSGVGGGASFRPNLKKITNNAFVSVTDTLSSTSTITKIDQSQLGSIIRIGNPDRDASVVHISYIHLLGPDLTSRLLSHSSSAYLQYPVAGYHSFETFSFLHIEKEFFQSVAVQILK